MPTKQIHIRVPRKIYEEFYRLFPERGARTRYLIEKIQEAIADARLTNKAMREVREAINSLGDK